MARAFAPVFNVFHLIRAVVRLARFPVRRRRSKSVSQTSIHNSWELCRKGSVQAHLPRIRNLGREAPSKVSGQVPEAPDAYPA